MHPLDDWRILNQPFYAQQANEVTLFEAAYAARLPVMVKGPTGCGKKRRAEVGARSAHQRLTRRDCLSVAPAGRAASSATGHEAEYRKAVGTQCRPFQ